MTDRRYEQGGVVSFVVIATVLALLLAGTIWWAKTSTKTASVNTAPVAQSPKTTENSSTGQVGQGASTTQNNNPQSSNNSTSTNTNQPSTNTSSGTGSNTGKVASTGPSSPEVATLPGTGPTETAASILGLGLLGGGLMMYIRSTKHVRASALK